MITELERAAKAMFPPEGSLVSNVKFFTLNRSVTGEQLAEQLNRADAQISACCSKLVEDIDGDLTIERK
jgi:hypothetical protein